MRGWPSMPFHADAPDGLVRLRDAGWKLAVLTNCDDDLWATTAARLPVEFDLVVTAQQVGSYKPAPGHFERFREVAQPAEDGWVHVACSWFHDMQAARDLGLRRIWVDRDRTGQDPAIANAVLRDLRRPARDPRARPPRARAEPREGLGGRPHRALPRPTSTETSAPGPRPTPRLRTATARPARRRRAAARPAGSRRPRAGCAPFGKPAIQMRSTGRRMRVCGDRLAQRGAEPRVGLGVVAVGEGAVRVEAVRQAVGVDRADRRRAARAASPHRPRPRATPRRGGRTRTRRARAARARTARMARAHGRMRSASVTSSPGPRSGA